MVRMMPQAHSSASKKRRRKNKKKKLALVLAGGGITGAMYEIGALQALDRAFAGQFSVTDFDIIIGLSAGAFVGSLLANGVAPAEMFFALDEQSRHLDALSQWDIYYPNLPELVLKPLSFPLKLLQRGLHDLFHPGEFDIHAYLDSLDEMLPSGLFTNERIEVYLRRTLGRDGRTNDFRRLDRHLYIVATDLDTGQRVIFGEEPHRDVPISKAVQASTALPLLYKPVMINGREFIDGAIRKSLHIDIALERGADLVICINPLVPLYNDWRERMIPLLSGRGHHLSQKGMASIAHQVMRIMVHSRISSGYEKYRHLYPDVDILLIEPRREDREMFFYKTMNYSARVSIARHGYEETLEALLKHFDHFEHYLRRHDIRLSRSIIRSGLMRVKRVPPNSYDEIKRLLYPTTEPTRTVDKLNAALDILEEHLSSPETEKRLA